MEKSNAKYLDLWDAVPENEFTNSAVHVTPRGSTLVADKLATMMQRMIQ
jgi:hypothetical protein